MANFQANWLSSDAISVPRALSLQSLFFAPSPLLVPACATLVRTHCRLLFGGHVGGHVGDALIYGNGFSENDMRIISKLEEAL